MVLEPDAVLNTLTCVSQEYRSCIKYEQGISHLDFHGLISEGTPSNLNA